MELLTKACGEGSGESCFRGLQVTVDRNLVGTLIVDPSGEGLISTNGFVNLKLYMRRVSQTYYVVDINPGIRVYVSVDGAVQIEAQSALYRAMVSGAEGYGKEGGRREEGGSASGGCDLET